ncbi:MAG TPA: hypothetical protein VG860_06660 [Terriglobia bacterium]|jgi:hypothetical protein|nr:hypothetical protein [Terriglobia bacterium]
MASTELRPFFAKKEHELTEEVKQQIRHRIEQGDTDVYKLAAEFDCAPIQIAGIKAALRKAGGIGTTGIASSEEVEDLTDPRKFLNHLLSSARARAIRAGLEFNLDKPPEFLAKLYEDQGGACDVTGIKFNLTRFPDVLVKHPYAPSIDQIHAGQGYVVGNVRLVCVAVNFGMGEWGQQVYLTLARAAVKREHEQEKDEQATPVQAVVDEERRRKPEAEKQRDTLAERLDAAEKLLPLLPESEQEKQRHRIAGFKAALTKRMLAASAAEGATNQGPHRAP